MQLGLNMKKNSSSTYVKRLNEASAAYQVGDYSKAERLYESLVQDYPEKAEPRFNYGVAIMATGDHIKALGHFIQAAELAPENAEYLAWIGKSLVAAGHHNMAIDQYKKALELDENNLTALTGLGYLYTRKSINNEAVIVLRKAIFIKPSNANNQANLALVLARLGDHELAIKHANKAITLEPKNPNGYFTLGNIQFIHGDTNNAINSYHKALEIDPFRGNAYYLIAAAKKITLEDKPFIHKMEAMLNKSMSLEARQNLLFALGKAYDDLKDVDKAFPYIDKANMLVHSNFNPSSHSRTIKQIKHVFNDNYFSKRALTSNGEYTPIFIVGMPRSGSTLIDQMLSTHSMVHSVGESSAIPDIIDEIIL